MCYNVKVSVTRKKLEERAKAKAPKDLPDKLEFNTISGFAHPRLPIVTSEEPDTIELTEWGLVPNWVNNEQAAAEMRNATLNARAETLFDKPSFKSIVKKRCLIFINGFYEWQTIATKTKRTEKKPFYIHLKSQDIFTLGGLYDEWVNVPTGEIKRGFSIITVPANPLMEVIHNTKKRMPFILNPQQEANWLNPSLSQSDIKELMQPYTEEDMEAVEQEDQKNNRPEQTGRLFE